MSSLDHDNDGLLDEKDMRLYLKSGEKMVDAFKGFAETNGIVGALILSVVYPLALQQEIEHFDFCFLEDDSNGSAGAATATLSRHEVRRVYLQTAAVVMLSIACILALALVIFSARIHTQISFWMPNLESKVSASAQPVMTQQPSATHPSTGTRRTSSSALRGVWQLHTSPLNSPPYRCGTHSATRRRCCTWRRPRHASSSSRSSRCSSLASPGHGGLAS